MTQPDLLLQYCGEIVHSPDWYMPADQHPFHEVIAVESGAMSVLIHGQKIRAQTGQVLFYRSGSQHTEWTDPSHPATTLCMGYYGDRFADKIHTVTEDREGRIRQMLRWAHADRSLPTQARAQRLGGLVAAVIDELAYLANSAEPPLVARTRAFVQNHLAEPITLERLAAQAGMSKYHFLRQYRAQTGVTPMAAVRHQRIDLARNLLVCTPWPLRVIAKRVGFDNEFHLSRVFRQLTGVPPGALRRQAHGTTKGKADPQK